MIAAANVTEEEENNNSGGDEDSIEDSTLEDIRRKVQEYFLTVHHLQNPKVKELFQKLNETLENPDSETKQAVRGII